MKPRPSPRGRCRPALFLAHQTESHVHVTEIRVIVAAGRCPAVPGTVRPAATPKNPERARGGAFGVRHASAGIRAIDVLNPLPDIPDHVVQPPGIRSLLAHRMRRLFTVVDAPRDAVQSARIAVCPGSRPRRVLPLRLGRQAIAGALCSRIQQPDEFLHVLPGHLFHRAGPAPAEVRRIRSHHGLPFRLGRLVFSKPEPLGDANPRVDLFVAVGFPAGSAHSKLARWNPDEFHCGADRADPRQLVRASALRLREDAQRRSGVFVRSIRGFQIPHRRQECLAVKPGFQRHLAVGDPESIRQLQIVFRLHSYDPVKASQRGAVVPVLDLSLGLAKGAVGLHPGRQQLTAVRRGYRQEGERPPQDRSPENRGAHRSGEPRTRRYAVSGAVVGQSGPAKGGRRRGGGNRGRSGPRRPGAGTPAGPGT